MTTYRVIDDKTFEFEIYGKETSRNSYVAVGFSEDSGMVNIILNNDLRFGFTKW